MTLIERLDRQRHDVRAKIFQIIVTSRSCENIGAKISPPSPR